MLTHAADTLKTRRRARRSDLGVATILAVAALVAVFTSQSNATVTAQVALSAEVIESRTLP